MTTPPPDALEQIARLEDLFVKYDAVDPGSSTWEDAAINIVEAITDATPCNMLRWLLPLARAQLEGWRPIETAPRDGTSILLSGPYPENDEGLPTRRVTAGFWCAPEPPIIGDCGGDCRCPEYDDPEEPYWTSLDGGFTKEWPPTHWQPLPTPPQKDEGDD